jgi:hypothetical protein
MIKPEYIENLEKIEGIYSVIEMETPLKSITVLDSNKNLETVYVESKFSEDNKNIINKKLYKTTGEFYICWEKGKGIDMYYLSVYYKPEKIQQILIFLRQLNKK